MSSLRIFPSLRIQCSCISNRFWFFSLKNKSIKKKNPKSKVTASECRVLGGLRGNQLQNFQFESPKMKLREFVRVPTVSNWAKFAVQISMDEAPTPLLTVGLLFIFVHLSRVHLATLKIHSVSQTQPNFEQRTSPKVVNNSGNKATISQESHSYLHKPRC